MDGEYTQVARSVRTSPYPYGGDYNITIISNKIRASEEQKSRRAQPGLTSESLVRATQGVLSRDVTDVGRLGR